MKPIKRALGVVALTCLFTPTFFSTPAKAMIQKDAGTVVETGEIRVGGTAKKPELNIPDGTYMFTDHSVLQPKKGKPKKKPNMFEDILTVKQQTIMDDIDSKSSDSFKDDIIEGDLTYGKGWKSSFWKTDPQVLKTNTTPTTFKIAQKNVVYKIYVPPGNNGTMNQAYINNAIAGIEEYKKSVTEAALAGAVKASFNVYVMHPSRQVPLTDILDADIKDGKKTGEYTVKDAASGVQMVYSLSQYTNPFYGSITPDKVEKIDDFQKYWEKKRDKLTFKVKSGGKLKLPIDGGYTAFIEEVNNKTSTITKLTKKDKADGKNMEGFKATYYGKKVKIGSMADSAMYLATPQSFAKQASSTYYKMSKKGGYHIFPKIKVDITKESLYQMDGDKLDELGSFSAFGLDPKYAVFGSVTAAEDEPSRGIKKGAVVGAIIPMKYKEGVYDTGQSGEKTKYYTGRTIIFSNDYSEKMEIDASNRDIMAVQAKNTGKLGIQIRRFAFPEKSDYTNAESHKELEDAPNYFDIHVVFENDADVKGFVIYRNNAYLNDADLIKWLRSDEANAMTGVDAKTLYNLVTGKMDLERKQLTYAEWNRLQEMKQELDTDPIKKLRSIIRITMIVFGFILFVYSILLVLLWFLDIFDLPLGFSLLHYATGKRLYPVTSKEDALMYNNNNEGVRYITLPQIIILALIVMGISLIFVFGSPIIEFITNLYFTITSWTGVG